MADVRHLEKSQKLPYFGNDFIERQKIWQSVVKIL